MVDPNSIGQDRTYKDSSEAHDAEHGTYTENVSNVPTDSRLPTVHLPKGQDPAPFNIGPQTGGER